ncbi:MAG: hypothetical protein ABSE91_01315 [Patescibacteria group bacterium]|jgi:hypothetical protein
MISTIKTDPIISLYKSQKTVFSIKDLVLIWQIDNPDYLKTKINRLIKSQKIYLIRKGFYALDKNYDKTELANKMITPSYFGLYSILTQKGINFQYDSKIYSVSNQSRTITVENIEYVYKKIKDSALFNPIGINFLGNKTVASKERSIVDILYLSPNFSFDQLVNINWDLCLQIAQIYSNKRLSSQIKKLKENYA